MMHTLSRTRKSFAVAGIAMFGAFGLVSSAAAATTAVTYDVQASAVGQTADFTISSQVAASAPATVAASTAFTETLSVGAITVPTSASGYTVNNISGISLKLHVPANSTYTSASLSGGSGLGAGKPTVSESATTKVITIKVPGPIAAGTTITFPTLTLHLKSGAAGKTITTKLSGTSYTSPGLTFNASIVALGLNVTAACSAYPSPSPTLATTKIS